MIYKYWSKCKNCSKETVSAKRVICYRCVVTPDAPKRQSEWSMKRSGWKVIREDAVKVFFRNKFGQIRTIKKEYLERKGEDWTNITADHT